MNQKRKKTDVKLNNIVIKLQLQLQRYNKEYTNLILLLLLKDYKKENSKKKH